MATDLHLDWCSHKAAKFACKHWHYSHSIPTPPLVKIGVWESNEFVGVIIFSRGNSRSLGGRYGLKMDEVAELSRIALKPHYICVSRMVSISCRMIKASFSGLRLLISFADYNQGHVGTIYQASNWFYLGKVVCSPIFEDIYKRKWHSRQVSRTGVKRQYGELRRVPKIEDLKRIPQCHKYRYAFPLDKAMRKQIESLAKPYPKRPASIGSDASAIHAEEGSASLTAGLHS